MTTKICKQCELEKNILDFRHQTRGDKIYISGTCKKCDTINGRPRSKKFRENNLQQERNRSNKYYADNKDRIRERQKDKKPIRDSNYYLNNKERIQEKNNKRAKERYSNDPKFRIRHSISKSISRALKSNGHTKGGQSCLNFLPYDIQELKQYLENLFEPWMSWGNYGKYNAKFWNDADSKTWTWQIDHIKPQSLFNYKSMEEETFKECWKLENLRPYSSKQNWLDGINRTRHEDSEKKW